MRNTIVNKLMSGAIDFAEIGAARGGSKVFGYASGGLAGMGRFMSSPNGFNTVAGAAIGGTYGAMSDDTSVLGGMILGAGLGRYGGQGVRNVRAAYRGLRSGVGALGPVQPMGMGQAFGSAIKMGGSSSGALIGQDLTRAYNGFRGLFKGSQAAAPPTSVGSTLRRWRDPNSARSVRAQKIARDHASLRAAAENAMTPEIVKSARRDAAIFSAQSSPSSMRKLVGEGKGLRVASSARREAAAFKAQGQMANTRALSGSAAGIPNRAGTVKQGDSLWSLAGRDMAR